MIFDKAAIPSEFFLSGHDGTYATSQGLKAGAEDPRLTRDIWQNAGPG